MFVELDLDDLQSLLHCAPSLITELFVHLHVLHDLAELCRQQDLLLVAAVVLSGEHLLLQGLQSVGLSLEPLFYVCVNFDLKVLQGLLHNLLSLVARLLFLLHVLHVSKLYLQGLPPILAVLAQSLLPLLLHQFQGVVQFAAQLLLQGLQSLRLLVYLLLRICLELDLKGLQAILHHPLSLITHLLFLRHVLHGLTELCCQNHNLLLRVSVELDFKGLQSLLHSPLSVGEH
mmetsp:Transcript_65046/g.118699  ORF Transcript_65046/g.118699 Transcript_65046/m.118699 type:complete len:231 (+) Transcript_65046:1927-2619(+)